MQQASNQLCITIISIVIIELPQTRCKTQIIKYTLNTSAPLSTQTICMGKRQVLRLLIKVLICQYYRTSPFFPCHRLQCSCLSRWVSKILLSMLCMLLSRFLSLNIKNLFSKIMVNHLLTLTLVNLIWCLLNHIL